MKTSLILGIGAVIIALVIGAYYFQSPFKGVIPENTVVISNFAFSPATITVKVGTTVTWINKDTTSHTVTSDSDTELDSTTLNLGQEYKHEFSKAGIYNYHCDIHRSMKAKVIVE